MRCGWLYSEYLNTSPNHFTLHIGCCSVPVSMRACGAPFGKRFNPKREAKSLRIGFNSRQRPFKMELERAKGTRDFSAARALLRQKIVGTTREVFELFGFNPLETPLIERFDVLSSKYAGGEEILKETFKLKDQGGRELGLRYDLTVPMCRYIASNQNLKMPFKRYQIGEVFRDGPLKAGRYRQFSQCDVDVVGVKSMAADAEMIDIAQAVFKKLEIGVVIRVNNRKILNGILDSVGVKKDKEETVILTLDKLEKIGQEGVEKELAEKDLKDSEIKSLMSLVTVKGSNEEKMKELVKQARGFDGSEGITEIKELLAYVVDKKNVLFEPSLARGLAYYTGTVYEVFLTDASSGITSAVSAGGRYDKMIGNFVGSGREYPAVGISFGLDVIEDVLEKEGKNKMQATASVYIIPIKVTKEARKVASSLRELGVNTDIDGSERSVGKNLEYASVLGIPYSVFVGEKEVKAKKFKLRDMKTGKEKLLSIDGISKVVKQKT
jgi:histidyl-tRNA synthetase